MNGQGQWVPPGSFPPASPNLFDENFNNTQCVSSGIDGCYNRALMYVAGNENLNRSFFQLKNTLFQEEVFFIQQCII